MGFIAYLAANADSPSVEAPENPSAVPNIQMPPAPASPPRSDGQMPEPGAQTNTPPDAMALDNTLSKLRAMQATIAPGTPRPATPPQADPLSAPAAPPAKICKDDWTQCTDNYDLVNNYENYIHIPSRCQDAAEAQAKYGTPVWPGFWQGGSFSHFREGTDYVQTGLVVAIEPNAQFQNQYGAMVHSTAVCTYDLRSSKVISVNISENE